MQNIGQTSIRMILGLSHIWAKVALGPWTLWPKFLGQSRTLATDIWAKDNWAMDTLATDIWAMDTLAKDTLAKGDTLATDTLAKVDTLATDTLATDTWAKWTFGPQINYIVLLLDIILL